MFIHGPWSSVFIRGSATSVRVTDYTDEENLEAATRVTGSSGHDGTAIHRCSQINPQSDGLMTDLLITDYWLIGERQPDGHRGALAWYAVNADLALMGVHDVFHRCQAQPRPVRFRGEERVEDSIQE